MTKLDPSKLYFIPLGGSEQFGVNLNVYSFDGKFLAVDCGIGFADDRFPGVDLLLPDPIFLEENRKNLIGLVITHAHEDHIGAVAYLWPRLKCPIYCSRFTAEVLKHKFDEHNIKKAKIHIVEPLQSVPLKPFEVQFIPVSHSVPETMCLAITCGVGTVVHSGDWNLDPQPVLGPKTDKKVFQELGKKGVLAYIGDSTNANVDGRSQSETELMQGLTNIFSNQKGRILITIFSSNIGRVQSILKAAMNSQRQVAVAGRSLHRMIGVAKTCGYLQDVDDFVTENDLDHIPNEKSVLLVTGSQGEARAALARIARGHHYFKIQRGDTVVFSARAIPGNELEINHVKNNLIGAGVKVITPNTTDEIIHTSGHPRAQEIVDMLQWLKPKIVVPVHGERLMLEAQAAIARDAQVPHTIVPTNGAVICLDPEQPEIIDHVETGLLAVEPKRIMTEHHRALSERRKLQFTGTAHVSLVVDQKGRLLSAPHVTTMGLFDEEDEDEVEFMESMADEIFDFVKKLKKTETEEDHVLAEKVRIALRNYINKFLGLKPKTVVHVTRLSK